MQMPMLDGYETTRQLRRGGFEGPIVGVTADAFEENRARCLAAGCSAFVPKPIDAGLLRQTLSNLLEGSRATPRPSAPSTTLRDQRYEELVRQYRASLKNTVEDVEAALADGDVDSLNHVLHQLKGVAGSYGDTALSEYAGEANRALRNGASLEDARDLIAEVLGELKSLAAGALGASHVGASDGDR